MNRVLASFLGASLLINALALAHIMRGRTAPEAGSRRSAVAPIIATSSSTVASTHSAADLDSVLAELRQLRREVAAMREGRAVSSAPPQTDLPVCITSDPAVAALLAEQEALARFWSDLGKLSVLRESLGDEKHQQLVTRATAEFLGLDAGARVGFESAVRQMMGELEAAMKILNDGYAAGAENEPDYELLAKRYNESRDAAAARLAPYLGAAARHQQFRQNLESWIMYACPQAVKEDQ